MLIRSKPPPTTDCERSHCCFFSSFRRLLLFSPLFSSRLIVTRRSSSSAPLRLSPPRRSMEHYRPQNLSSTTGYLEIRRYPFPRYPLFKHESLNGKTVDPLSLRKLYCHNEDFVGTCMNLCTFFIIFWGLKKPFSECARKRAQTRHRVYEQTRGSERYADRRSIRPATHFVVFLALLSGYSLAPQAQNLRTHN